MIRSPPPIIAPRRAAPAIALRGVGTTIPSSSTSLPPVGRGRMMRSTVTPRTPPLATSTAVPRYHFVRGHRIMAGSFDSPPPFPPPRSSSAASATIPAFARRSYNFASSDYAACFDGVPDVDKERLREDALSYLENFDGRKWYDEPVCSILDGERLLAPSSYLRITKNSLDVPNGHQYFATPEQVDALLHHVLNYVSPYTDLRREVRNIERRLLTEYTGLLIGNQCLDFGKQDGVTEIEECIMANHVERRMNDMLFDDERCGKICISRRPIFVSCVSNFSNFLDLFRKTLRSLELGIPCLILGRSHTTQHPYRWTELLVQLMKDESIDPKMVTYLSCQLEDIVYITSRSSGTAGALYTTCSRDLAKSIKSTYPNTISSTGGPNTLLTTRWTRPVIDAIRTSASIECAGQCTALRHLVVPEHVHLGDVEAMFDDVEHLSDPVDALKDGAFDRIFDGHGGTSPPPSAGPCGRDDDGRGGGGGGGGEAYYAKHELKDAYFRVGPAYPSPKNDEVNEYWRKVVVDVTNILPDDDSSSAVDGSSRLGREVESLSRWLIRHQPISLAVNAERSRVLELGRALFEKTSLVVTTIGSTDAIDAPPAMTCQARPQDAECFGEFPPRKRMGEYTKFPVIIPSSTPSYDSCYREDYLESRTPNVLDGTSCPAHVKRWLSDVTDSATRGFCVELVGYLCDATEVNPKRGFGTGRTALWGLQRPPILDGLRTLVRCGPSVSFDDLSPIFLPFYSTNARSQAELSVDGSNVGLLDKLMNHDLDNHTFGVVVESEEILQHRLNEGGDDFYNVVRVPSDCSDKTFPLPGQFVSLYLPLGHIKSTRQNDEEFVTYFGRSEKWLKMA
ncbi:hypothetical protein ACHAXA_005013 [Cyclostephanos tholiformis]|uniref:Aldehyde dehydrogenase n=1 Tax=Cyclostephanos tholiformis TaxID=382380 RepID=A0ABD3RYY7_9STRA